ncbi:MAG: hypothetical protein PWP23_264 [Candidatus Sumerlaeota bacterium]|nr:hypothetical protein [Candidatus Sumerlaeota bacterium]
MSLRLLLLLSAGILMTFAPARAQESTDDAPADDLIMALDDAIFTNEDAPILEALKAILQAVNAEPDSYALNIAAAKGYLARADLLRVDRQTGKVDKAREKAMRAQQALWGEKGAEHAEKAKRLATTKQEKSEAYRLCGECTVHRIDGPLSGMRYGPTAKSDIEFAVSQDSTNWQARRAQGLMFLNNPPINGGDLDKAVETFALCAKNDEQHADVHHAFLAQAWMKLKRPERAKLEVQKSLLKNPANRLANNIKARLQENKQW